MNPNNPVIPGQHPLQSLAQAFVEKNLPLTDKVKQLGEVEEQLKQGADGLRRSVQCYQSNKDILAIDQFEEFFTLCENQNEREQFFQCLLGALEQLNNKLCIILAMRSDFFSKCSEYNYNRKL